MDPIDRSLVEDLVFIEDLEPRLGAAQMAIDEFLLLNAEMPTLRVYRWLRPTVSLGYFESLARVRARFGEEAQFDYVRRWTGGGAVLHDGDFTYALAVPHRHPLAGIRPAKSYRAVHRILSMALSSLGVPVELMEAEGGSSSYGGNGFCFESPVESDVIFEGRKISGAGQRRSRVGLLHQGTVQGISIPAGLGSAFAKLLAVKVLTAGAPDWSKVDDSRYRSEAWLQRR